MSAKKPKLKVKDVTNLGHDATQNTTGKFSPPQAVHFEYLNGEARKVCLAGDFNDWRPESAEMHSMGGGKWAKDLALAPGSYEYRLVVDGQWLSDPGNGEHVPNPFGDQNSIKVVPPHAPLLHANLPGVKQSALAKR